jgi:hypothetical protein
MQLHRDKQHVRTAPELRSQRLCWNLCLSRTVRYMFWEFSRVFLSADGEYLRRAAEL